MPETGPDEPMKLGLDLAWVISFLYSRLGDVHPKGNYSSDCMAVFVPNMCIRGAAQDGHVLPWMTSVLLIWGSE